MSKGRRFSLKLMALAMSMSFHSVGLLDTVLVSRTVYMLEARPLLDSVNNILCDKGSWYLPPSRV